MGFLNMKKGLLFLCILSVLFSAPLLAEESIDINALRAQFTKNQNGTAEHSPNGFSNVEFTQPGNPALDAETSKLEAAEAALLKKLGSALPDQGSRARQKPPVDQQFELANSAQEDPRGTTDELSILITEYDALKAKFDELKSELKESSSANNVLSIKAKDFESKNNRLVKELESLRNRLMIAETEVSRLSAVLRTKNRSKLGYVSKQDAARKESVAKALKTRASRIPTKQTGDLSYATVIVDKANLRTGPGLNNSPLMTVAKGTRLFVETREGNWYRVITPTNTRAWVSSEVVSFGTTRDGSPTKTLRVKGFDETL